SNFKDMGKHLEELGFDDVTGVLLDLGLSSHQIDAPQRGFSFDRPGKLDMRMDQRKSLTAEKILHSYSREQLTALFKNYGNVAQASHLSRLIIKERDQSAIQTIANLKALVSQIAPFRGRAKTLAKVFQALRIAVNRELDNLTDVLGVALKHLKVGGRIVVISYHSLEDRIVKEFFREESPHCICPPETPVCICGEPGRLKILTKKPIRASENEIQRNRRSRSAKLRAAELL
ncbi:16S rRNA (cytosine(1402)-N(4))-methyltransferase RsmH, partial [bacterium]|nr:16S rRNA (cytosine(1402)-N(4))-methyltransferase RsmH [bacterium]